MTTINTLTGKKEIKELGLIDPHEHIFMSLLAQYSKRQNLYDIKNSDRDKVSLENLGVLRRNCYLLKDNLVVDDFGTQVKELSYFKNAGGNTIIEQTPFETDPEKRMAAVNKLKDLSEVTGINMIVSTGFMTDNMFPQEYMDADVKTLSEHFVAELTEGIAGSSIKAGVIGEIGTGPQITPTDEKQIRAAALAHKETGAKINIHLYPWGKETLRILAILNEYGVAMENICICHLDVLLDHDHMKAVLDKGVYIEFDDFGKEFYIISEPGEFAGGSFSTDIERVRMIRKLVEEGYQAQILAANDLAMKIMLHRYGGWGYDHILHNIVPMMLAEGIHESAIKQIVYQNPHSFLE